MAKLEPHEVQFHAERMLENPAWRALFNDVRARLASERDKMTLDDPQRQHVSIAETVLTRLERHAAAMARPDTVSDINAANAARVA